MDRGKVLKILNGNKAIVFVDKTGDCDCCSAKGGCNIFNKKDNNLLVKYSGKIEPGDIVNIIIKPANRILISTLIFFIPVIFLILFYFLGKYFFKTENMAVLSSFFGLVASFCLIIYLIRINKNKDNLLPYITKNTE